MRTTTALITGAPLSGGLRSVGDEEQTIHNRKFHHRAVDAVVWATPLLNFNGSSDGHAAVRVGYNDVAYRSKVQNWEFQTVTPSEKTPYVNFYWTVKQN